MLTSGKQIIDYHDRLVINRVAWGSHWQELAEYVQPRKARITRSSEGPPDGIHEKLFDTTGVSCNMQLAGGQLSWITPSTAPWFIFKPDRLLEEDDQVASWLTDCASEVREMLSESNFYTEVHEMYLDRSGFGTSCLFEDYDQENRRLFFHSMPVGSYVCAENARGLVDTVMYARTYTVRQAMQLFGKESLPEVMQKQAADPKESEKPHLFVHAVFPRTEFKAGNPFSSNYPVASVWVHRETATVVAESGYLEMPYFVTRFLRWEQTSMVDAMPGESGPWGWSPAWAALPDLRQLNHLEKQMDALADRQVNPPVLMPEDLDTRADLRPGGVTLFNADKGPGGIPQEWVTGGRYDIGQIRAEEKRNRVKDHFMVRLFSMFEGLDPGKEMTAFEVAQRQQEKIDLISPSFALLTTELLTPLLRKTFSLALQHGRLPAPPPQMIAQNQAGEWEMLAPKIEFNSRLALAISSSQTQGLERSLEFAERVSAFRPEVWDNLDVDEGFRRLMRHQGVDEDVIKDKGRMEAERMQRAQMAAEAAQAGMAKPV